MGSLDHVLQPHVLIIIAVHWTVAILLVFVNKQLVTAEKGSKYTL
jgi:hypothetical protein